jgi:thioredoxin-dependent peroxiredoxin
MPQAGDMFPNFTAQSQEGETIDLTAYRGDKHLVAFFYPKANTGG